MFQSILCRIKGHRVNRRKAWHDGRDFRSRCSRCSHPMIRDSHGWRPDDDPDAPVAPPSG